MTDTTTVNGYIMTSLYIGKKKIKTTVNSGFASISQKHNLVKLKVLKNVIVTEGSETVTIDAGSFVLVKEELLHTQKALVCKYQIEEKGDDFMLIPFSYVVGIVE